MLNTKLIPIEIGCRKYFITFLNDEDFDLYLSQKNVYDVSVKSFIDYDEQLIGVRDKLKNDHKQELIVHELLHACAEDAGMDQDENFEKFVRSFSPRLTCLLKNGLNDILSYILKENVNF